MLCICIITNNDNRAGTYHPDFVKNIEVNLNIDILEIDVMGELLVISDVLVKEMRKTENPQLMAQEVYNLELTKLQSEKTARVKINLGQNNRFRELICERMDKNPLSATPLQVHTTYFEGLFVSTAASFLTQFHSGAHILRDYLFQQLRLFLLNFTQERLGTAQLTD